MYRKILSTFNTCGPTMICRGGGAIRHWINLGANAVGCGYLCRCDWSASSSFHVIGSAAGKGKSWVIHHCHLIGRIHFRAE